MKEQVTLKHDLKGVYMVVACGVLWGVGGIVTQLIFQNSNMTPGWLVFLRMFFAGFGVVIYEIIKNGKKTFDIFRDGKSFCAFVFYMFFGVILMQFSYSTAIKKSNAATATVLQYTYPIFVLFYTAIEKKKISNKAEIIAVFSTFTGVFLIATHGNIDSLSISSGALFWGLMSSLAFVVYTVFPRNLFKKYDSTLLLGLSMAIGSIIMYFSTGCYSESVELNRVTIIGTAFITIFGCLIPLSVYSKGVEILGNVKASLFVTVEPLSCAIISYFMGLFDLKIFDILGLLLILIPIELITIIEQKKSKKQTA